MYSDLELNATLEGCWAAAELFDNTCNITEGAATSVSAMHGANMTCSNTGTCPSNGWENVTINFTNSTGNFSRVEQRCNWVRKLCVTCRMDNFGQVYVRAQTNSLPNHCFQSPRETPNEFDVDYEVKWMSSVSYTQTDTTQSTTAPRPRTAPAP